MEDSLPPPPPPSPASPNKKERNGSCSNVCSNMSLYFKIFACYIFNGPTIIVIACEIILLNRKVLIKSL
jgi:hypothetical protein